MAPIRDPCQDQGAGISRLAVPPTATAAAPQSYDRAFGAGAGRGPVGHPKSRIRTWREGGFAPLETELRSPGSPSFSPLRAAWLRSMLLEALRLGCSGIGNSAAA